MFPLTSNLQSSTPITAVLDLRPILAFTNPTLNHTYRGSFIELQVPVNNERPVLGIFGKC